MKRLLVTSFATLLFLSASSFIFAQGTHHGTTTSNTERSYVLVEHTGLEINCSLLPSQQEVNNRIKQLQQNNDEALKANKPLLEEIKKLTSQLTTKKHELANAKDEAAKADIQKQIDDLTSQIADKKSQLKPLVTWEIPPKLFSKRADADKYIEAKYKQAEDEKAKAAKKEADKKEADSKK